MSVVNHAQGELLAQIRPSSTSPELAFQASELRAEITLITAVIDPIAGPSQTDIAIYHDDAGSSTYDQTTILFSETRLQLLQDNIVFQAQHPGSGLHIKPNGQLAVQTADADDVTFNFYGITETLAERIRGQT